MFVRRLTNKNTHLQKARYRVDGSKACHLELRRFPTRYLVTGIIYSSISINNAFIKINNL